MKPRRFQAQLTGYHIQRNLQRRFVCLQTQLEFRDIVLSLHGSVRSFVKPRTFMFCKRALNLCNHSSAIANYPDNCFGNVGGKGLSGSEASSASNSSTVFKESISRDTASISLRDSRTSRAKLVVCTEILVMAPVRPRQAAATEIGSAIAVGFVFCFGGRQERVPPRRVKVVP